MSKRDRSNAYYLRALQTKAPDVHRRWLAGEFKSVAAALRAAGIRKPPKAINDLLRAWKKASAAERADFSARVGLTLAAAPSPATAPSPSAMSTVTVCGPDLRLTPDGARRIKEIMDKRKIKTGVIMKEIGFPSLDGTLGIALRHRRVLNLVLVSALQAWVDRH